MLQVRDGILASGSHRDTVQGQHDRKPTSDSSPGCRASYEAAAAGGLLHFQSKTKEKVTREGRVGLLHLGGVGGGAAASRSSA